jgi:hypothetical protein
MHESGLLGCPTIGCAAHLTERLSRGRIGTLKAPVPYHPPPRITEGMHIRIGDDVFLVEDVVRADERDPYAAVTLTVRSIDGETHETAPQPEG